MRKAPLDSMNSSKIPESISIAYQAAQLSAQHHNTMIWVLFPLVYGFVFYTIVNLKELSKNLPMQTEAGYLMVAAIAVFYLHVLVLQANERKLLKYSICQMIERRYRIPNDILVKRFDEKSCAKPIMRIFYGIVNIGVPLGLLITLTIRVVLLEKSTFLNLVFDSVMVVIIVGLGGIYFWRLYDHSKCPQRTKTLLSEFADENNRWV